MNDKELRSLLIQNTIDSPDQAYKDLTIQLAVQQAASQRPVYHQSFFSRLIEQIPYISKFMWVFYTVFMMFFCYLFFAGYYSLNSMLLLSTLTPFLSAIAFCEILKSYFSRMWELEQSCTYNLQQIMSLRLIIISTANYLVMLVFFILSISADIKAGIFLFLIVIPYQCENIVFFQLIKHFRSFEKSGFIVMSTAVLMSAIIYFIVTIALTADINYSAHINIGNALLVTFITFGIMIFYNLQLRNNYRIKEDSALWN